MNEARNRSAGERKVRIMFRKMGIWLDTWCMRGYTPDTCDWQSKLENLRNLKSTFRHLK